MPVHDFHMPAESALSSCATAVSAHQDSLIEREMRGNSQGFWIHRWISHTDIPGAFIEACAGAVRNAMKVEVQIPSPEDYARGNGAAEYHYLTLNRNAVHPRAHILAARHQDIDGASRPTADFPMIITVTVFVRHTLMGGVVQFFNEQNSDEVVHRVSPYSRQTDTMHVVINTGEIWRDVTPYSGNGDYAAIVMTFQVAKYL